MMRLQDVFAFWKTAAMQESAISLESTPCGCQHPPKSTLNESICAEVGALSGPGVLGWRRADAETMSLRAVDSGPPDMKRWPSANAAGLCTRRLLSACSSAGSWAPPLPLSSARARAAKMNESITLDD